MNQSLVLEQSKPESGFKAWLKGIWNGFVNHLSNVDWIYVMDVSCAGMGLVDRIIDVVWPEFLIAKLICKITSNALPLLSKVIKLCKDLSCNNSEIQKYLCM